MEENISVAVRIRPLTSKERKDGQLPVWRTEGNHVISKTQETRAVSTPSTVASRTGAGSAIATPARARTSTARPSTTGAPSSRSLSGRRPSGPRSASASRHTTPSTLGGKFASGKPRTYDYAFDSVFRPSDTTAEVYERLCESLVWSAMDGYNATIFAYGQTGSGKTHTIRGSLKRNPGVIPMAIQDVFAYIRETQEREFLLRVSYFEIYNEVINDLLAPENKNLQVREHRRTGVFIENLKEEIVLSPDQVMSLLAAGETYRHVGSTNYNVRSSRSHTIFRVVIESKVRVKGDEKDGEDAPPAKKSAVRVSSLSIIDLAGSEKAHVVGSTRDLGGRRHTRLLEGSSINKSLLVLGNVISRLSAGEKRSVNHIPYRDSKLTRILEPSLQGNARVAIICTIAVATNYFEETNNTLKFASRAKKIRNKAKINEYVDDKSLIRQYRNQINELKQRLRKAMEAQSDSTHVQSLQQEKARLEVDNQTLAQKAKEFEEEKNCLEEKINRLSKLILVSSSVTSSPSHLQIMMKRQLKGRKRHPHSPHSSPLSPLTADGASPTTSPTTSQPQPQPEMTQRQANGRSRDEESPPTTPMSARDMMLNNETPMANGQTDSLKTKARNFDTDDESLPLHEMLLQEIRLRDEQLESLRATNEAMAQQRAALKAKIEMKERSEVIAQERLEEKTTTMEELMLAHSEQSDLKREFTLMKKILEQQYASEVEQLRGELAEQRLEAELHRADNAHLANELKMRERAARAWRQTLREYQRKQLELYEDNKRLKAHLANWPDYYSDEIL